MTPTVFFIGPEDLRRELYKDFQVIEPVVGGKPIYLATCRHCGRTVVTLERSDRDVDSAPLRAGQYHLRVCSSS
jgi:hypothetical protein